MVRAGTRTLDARRTEQAGILLLLAVMAVSLALVLERLVQAGPAAVPVAAVAVLAGWVLSSRPMRSGWWLPAAGLAGAAMALWQSGAALHPETSLLGQLLAMRVELLADPSSVLDATSISGRVAGSLALLTLVWAGPLLAARACRLGRSVAHAAAPMIALLLGGMALRRTDDIGPLVAFAAGAMLLSVAIGTAARRRRWERRGITDAEGVTGSMARHGWVVTAATVTLAWALTSVAVGAPLEGAWRQVGEWWSAQRPGGIGAGPAGAFRPTFDISDAFNPSRDVIAYVSGASGPVYLRAVTHDSYTGLGWTQAVGRTRSVAAGAPLLVPSSLELPGLGVLGNPVEVTVRLERGGDGLLLPGHALSLSIPASISEAAAGPFLVSAASAELQPGDTYSVLTTVRHASGAELAGAAAPDAAQLAPYLALDNVSPRTREEAERITAAASTPYGKAVALLQYLRGDGFRYSVRAARPDAGSGQDFVDYFLFDDAGRVGFCEQFASAMVVMARSVGIPARLARGYTGGERIGRDAFRVRGTQRHAWAELFFPGFGWQVFEATPSVSPLIRPGGQEPGGVPVASERPTPSAATSIPPPRSQGDGGGPRADAGGWLPTALAGGAGALAAILTLLAVRRRAGAHDGTADPRASPARLWSRLTRDAARIGLAPMPSQTAYEFARAVEHVLPDIGPDVGVLAAAYVSEVYAGPERPPRQGADVSDAWRRVVARLRRARFAQLVRRGARR
ncbi:MAG TPA: transglutaminase domain-containing protein [Candidatus Limnocylindria bacterium]